MTPHRSNELAAALGAGLVVLAWLLGLGWAIARWIGSL